MQLCLMIEGQEGVSWDEWVALAQGCERHGIPALFRSDHYMNLDGEHPERGSLDAWATLTRAGRDHVHACGSARWSRPATFRHPRCWPSSSSPPTTSPAAGSTLGLGRRLARARARGLRLPVRRRCAARMDVLEEQLQIVLGSWSDGRFSFERRRTTRCEELDAQPKPVQRPHPPLIMGGAAGPRSVALAARYADEYNTPVPHPRAGARAPRRRRRGVRARRARPDPVLGHDRGRGRRRRAPSCATAPRALAEQDRRRRRALLREPPAGWIVGTVDQAAEQLLRAARAGVARVMCQHLLHEDLDAVALIGERWRRG